MFWCNSFLEFPDVPNLYNRPSSSVENFSPVADVRSPTRPTFVLDSLLLDLFPVDEEPFLTLIFSFGWEVKDNFECFLPVLVDSGKYFSGCGWLKKSVILEFSFG